MNQLSCRLAAAVAVWALAAPGVSAAAEADYAVDAVHSTVLFRVKHMGTSYAFGRFNDVSGRFGLGDEAGAVDVVAKSGSIDTGNAKRDQHLRGADFLNAAQFPEIRFKSTRVEKVSAGSDAFRVTGDLTLHGVTRPVTVKMERTGANKDMRGTPIAGLYGEFAVKRSDFGMKGMIGPVGDEIRVTVSLEGARR
jgi:polyisoprenoid-binding protein YceI